MNSLVVPICGEAASVVQYCLVELSLAAQPLVAALGPNRNNAEEFPLEFVNRKPIRPSSIEAKDQMIPPRRTTTTAHKKVTPPDQTNAENFYYMKQMQSKTPMVIVMKDGETLEGIIEWYDKTCLKFNREGAPNLLVFKPNIKYMYKA